MFHDLSFQSPVHTLFGSQAEGAVHRFFRLEPVLSKCHMALTDCVMGTDHIDRAPVEVGHRDHNQKILTHRLHPNDRVYEQYGHRQSACAFR